VVAAANPVADNPPLGNGGGAAGFGAAGFVAAVAKRLLAGVLALILVVTATFFLTHLAPGKPSLLLTDNPRIPQEQRQRLAARLGLDQPLPVQYGRWLVAVARGDWGISFVHQRPVARVLAAALPSTLLLALATLPLQFGLALFLGMSAARATQRGRGGQLRDQAIRVVSLVFYSLPLFWLALMAILLFAVRWPLFPASHMRSVDAEALSPLARLWDVASHLALPALVLAVSTAGGIARFVRGGLLEAIGQEFVPAARARGLSERRVWWGHALRSRLAPLVQLAGLQLPYLFGGSLVIEVVFAWPGIGRLAYDALIARDYPVILATTTLNAALVIAGNLVADILHAAADPRVRTT
jgi:peptide/nickel transport system permease protein